MYIDLYNPLFAIGAVFGAVCLIVGFYRICLFLPKLYHLFTDYWSGVVNDAISWNPFIRGLSNDFDILRQEVFSNLTTHEVEVNFLVDPTYSINNEIIRDFLINTPFSRHDFSVFLVRSDLPQIQHRRDLFNITIDYKGNKIVYCGAAGTDEIVGRLINFFKTKGYAAA